MKLYHATLKANLDSIRVKGINTEFSKGTEAVIWLHTAGRRAWAILHTQKRHQCSVNDIVILTLHIPRSKLRRRWRGLWTTTETLNGTSLSITEAEAFAASPIT